MPDRRILTFTSVLIIALVLAACANSDGVRSGTGEVQVLLTDAPSDYIASADVTFSRVYLKAEDDDTDNGDGTADVDLLAEGDDPVTYDLMMLRDGIEALLAEATVPEGTYHQLRMVVQSATVTLADGVTFEDGSNTATLFTPSGMQSGIKVHLAEPIPAEDGSLTIVVVDFDVDQNFVIHGDPTIPDGVRDILFTPSLHEKSRAEMRAG
jgi:hypothetical protein